MGTKEKPLTRQQYVFMHVNEREVHVQLVTLSLSAALMQGRLIWGHLHYKRPQASSADVAWQSAQHQSMAATSSSREQAWQP